MIYPKFRFDISQESARFNFNLLKERNFDLGSLLNQDITSSTNYASKFKDVEDLEKLLFNHSRWKSLKEKLLHGCDYPMEDPDEDIPIF